MPARCSEAVDHLRETPAPGVEGCRRHGRRVRQDALVPSGLARRSTCGGTRAAGMGAPVVREERLKLER